MLRGVNRQIIEVCETKNEYFERAILFVRPEYINENETLLRSEAKKTVENMGLGSVRLRGGTGVPAAPAAIGEKRDQTAKAEKQKRKVRKEALFVIGFSCLAGFLLAVILYAAARLFF